MPHPDRRAGLIWGHHDGVAIGGRRWTELDRSMESCIDVLALNMSSKRIFRSRSERKLDYRSIERGDQIDVGHRFGFERRSRV